MIPFYKDKYCKIYHGDCLSVMRSLKKSSVDLIVTSPPYNLNVKYSRYKDNKPRNEYLNWIKNVIQQCERLLSDDGSFFLNMGYSSKDPWIDIDVMNIAREFFQIQNRIVWVKSISIGYRTDESFGHFTPLSGNKYLNKTNELVFHFTKTDVEIDRLADGVVYVHPSNFVRWNNSKITRCRGNSWFIDYKTKRKKEKGEHPAIFPFDLPLQCIKLHGVHKNPIVFDPFVGIGTTCVAAKTLGLRSIGVDIDEKYLEHAVQDLKGFRAHVLDLDMKELSKESYIRSVIDRNSSPEIKNHL
jgi:site-specific DNA-methyltransferase (adenine-specific)